MFWKKENPEVSAGLTWFTYSIMLPDKDEDELTVIGNFYIRNTGNTPLNNPRICLRIKPPEGVLLGGKIGSFTHTALMIDGANAESWHYIQENWKEKALETGEHWLVPTKTRQLNKEEQLIFSHELRIPTNKDSKFIIVEGYFYSDELQAGIGSLNNITINF